MANFLSGSVLGGAAAVVVLGAASVLLPGRPDVAPPQAGPAEVVQPAETAPAAPAEIAKPTEETPPKEALLDPAPEVVAAPEPAKPVEPVAAEPAPDEPVATEPAPAEPAPAEGAKTLAPPAAGAAKLPESEGALSDAPPADAPKPDAPKVEEPVVALEDAPAGTPPLEKYAAKFDNPGDKPLFAVILFDTGAADVDRAALAALDFPVTFAIDPESANAAEAMAIYRKAGKEVVMLPADLPQGATAQDLEQNFQTYEAILPEAVAVMGTAKGGFQDSANMAKLIVPVVQAQGRGLITFDRGLNAAAQGAQRDGLAHAQVFRQVDGGGESVPVIRRYLDRAVFNAAQDGGALVMGETAPDTITALMEWSVEGRASDVTLAPVSALLKVQ